MFGEGFHCSLDLSFVVSYMYMYCTCRRRIEHDSRKLSANVNLTINITNTYGTSNVLTCHSCSRGKCKDKLDIMRTERNTLEARGELATASEWKDHHTKAMR